MKAKVLHILLLLLFAGNMLSVAQDSRLMSRAELDSLMSPQIMQGGDNVLRFENLLQDFGVIYETDSPLTVEYHFVNVSGKPVSITRITTNCGCTATEIGDSLLSPGEKGVIRIKFNPRRRSGTVDTNTFVYTSLSSKTPVAKLTLLGNVIDNDEWSHLPVVMGCLRTKRRSVVFEPLKGGTEPQQRIPCVNVGKDSVRLSSSILPSYARLSTEPSVIAPGEEADIIITIVGSVLPKELPGSFNIVLDGIGGPLRDRTIKVTLNR